MTDIGSLEGRVVLALQAAIPTKEGAIKIYGNKGKAHDSRSMCILKNLAKYQRWPTYAARN